MTQSPAPTFPALRTRTNTRARITSAIMMSLCTLFTITIIGMLSLVLLYLIPTGIKALNLNFFTTSQISIRGEPGYPGGMLHGLYGTLVMVGLAAVAGIPIGLLGGVYLSEYGGISRFANGVRFVADVLAGVPSIVVGVLGYELLVLKFGNSGIAGAFALAFIMIPIITRTTEEMLRLVPQSYREGSIALGASKARTIVKVVIPSALGSLLTGMMLAVARVAGETAPLLFTAGGLSRFEANPSHPFPSLTQQVYQDIMESSNNRQSVGQAGILVLIAAIFVFNLMVRMMVNRKNV